MISICCISLVVEHTYKFERFYCELFELTKLLNLIYLKFG